MTTIKNLTIWIFLSIIGISGIINISKQFFLLKEARANNRKVEDKVNELIEINGKLERQIESATSSAFIEQTARNNFGLGTENDFWIIATPEDKNLNLYPEKNKTEEKPFYQQWINLFTP